MSPALILEQLHGSLHFSALQYSSYLAFTSAQHPVLLQHAAMEMMTNQSTGKTHAKSLCSCEVWSSSCEMVVPWLR